LTTWAAAAASDPVQDAPSPRRPGRLPAALGGRVRETGRTWRRLPASLWLLISARGVNQLGAFTLPFLAILLTRRLHLSVTEAGSLVALFGVATIPGRMLGGHLADWIGYRATIVLGLLATATGQLGVALFSTRMTAPIWLVLLGLAFEVYEPPSQALVADLTSDWERSAAYGAYSAVITVMGVPAGLLAVLVGHIGLSWLFVIDAGTCAGCALLIGVRLRVPPALRLRSRSDGASHHGSGARGPRQRESWVRDPALLAMLAAGTAFAIVFMQISILTPLTLAARGISPSDFGILSCTSALTVIAGQPLLSRRRGEEPDPFTAMAVSYVLLCIGLSAYGFAQSIWEFIGATVIWSIGDIILLGRAMAVVASIAPAGERGRYMSVYGLSWGLAIAIAPFTGTQMLQRWGTSWTWGATALLCAALALLQPLVGRVVGKASQRHPVGETIRQSSAQPHGQVPPHRLGKAFDAVWPPRGSGR
jgi:MFS family permease